MGSVILRSSFPNVSFPKMKRHNNVLLAQKISPKRSCFAIPVRSCSSDVNIANQTVVRRSGNYKASIWDFEFVQSLKNEHVGNKYIDRIRNLKEQVRMMLNNVKIISLEQLELIDTLQRLGLAYHFQAQIQNVLNTIHIYNNNESNKDLHATALQFRLLRQHGFNISSQETFGSFQDEDGNFRASLCEDYKGMLSLYEASFLSKQDENILEEAREFARSNLAKHQNQDSYFTKLVDHALELPLHWRMARLESRWYIDVYSTKQEMNPLVLELAKLDFNIVQATHQADLQYASCWWKNTGLGEKLTFARDRIMENFLWTIGVINEPQFGYCRRMLTKVNALITTIDDIYDVYGTLDELQLFTAAVQRWDIDVIEQLPEYMKICYLALHNSINEIGYDVLKERGFHVIPYLKKAWADICEAYLLEAKWYHSGYIPTLEEYIQNAWISISAPLILVHAYFLTKDKITIHGLKFLEEYPHIIHLSSMILRLADDLGTSSEEMKRGDVPKSIQCYMNESGASEEKAREYIHHLIGETWKKMNEEQHKNSPFSKTYIGIAMNLARMAQCMYQHGDGHGIQDYETKDRVLSLLVQPLPLPSDDN
ncbi:Myrcene synthase chloroplastic [Euphorbia peplus]|nr:Myrcene synthase chloroplastic [Euphorbia peplus]